MVHTASSSTGEAVIGRSEILGQPGLQEEACHQENLLTVLNMCLNVFSALRKGTATTQHNFNSRKFQHPFWLSRVNWHCPPPTQALVQLFIILIFF